MQQERLSLREVLNDKRGISTSLPETMGGIGIKSIGLIAGGGMLATLMVFWAVVTASADTSSGFQTADIGFEKAVSGSSVVIGGASNRVGIFNDTVDGRCQVKTWQGGSRDGKTTLVVESSTVAGVCTPTTPLVANGAGETRQELLFNIEAPAFTYSNLGGRIITFSDGGAPTLASGTKPAAVSLADWNDVRPYSVKLNLTSLNQNASHTAKKAELSGITNVVNVTVAQDDLRYVPTPSTDPVPGPVRITGLERSTTMGATYGGVHEGVAITVAGAVCEAGPTKLTASYTQQSPTAVAAVSTVMSAKLTGAGTTLNLGSTPNGSSGAVEVSATCSNGTMAEKANAGYTQSVPAPELTATQSAVAETHDLSWTKVSSLPTQYRLTWASTNDRSGAINVTTESASITQDLGTVYGFRTTYRLKATVDSVSSPNASPVALSNAWPSVAKPTLSNDNKGPRSNDVRWNWNAIMCPAGTIAQYSSAYWRHDIGLSAWSAPTLNRFYSVYTGWQGYDYSVDAKARCASAETGSASAYSPNAQGPQFTRVVDPPAPIQYSFRQAGERMLVTTPYTTCTGGAQLYERIVEASYDVIWILGPRSGNTGWYQNQPGWFDAGWGVIISHIDSPWDHPTGARFQVRAQALCEVPATGRKSGTIQSDSPVYTWR